MKFTATGHANIRSEHNTTVEFTKDDYVTVNGDCILGINADYKMDASLRGKIRLTIQCEGVVDEIIAEYNPMFDSHEMVIRKSGFLDRRTFAIHANKAAANIKRELVELAKQGKTMDIYISNI